MNPQSTETPATESAWGGQQAPNPGGRRWTGKKTAVTVAVALGIAGVGGAVAWAASSSDSSQTSSQGGPGGMGGMRGGMGGGADIMNALHGEFLVSDSSGGTKTELLQTGKVTAISATSITVVSDDNYTKTYVIDSSTTIGATTTGSSSSSAAVTNGESVTLIATESGDTATATSIREKGSTPDGGGMPGGAAPNGTAPTQGGN
ncbi:hypothetical protein [Actinokineospora inagensis]|uniref:hypothetical protein n=1 Tax=Actinokineospora inagensis TaxID=103730 RepID=UPI0004050021|nr:hypothetical protein [Actinokineospora inagensis]